MSEWWTYDLSDFLLFSPRNYYRLFELYNDAIWPAQLVALLAGVVILGLLRKPGAWHSRVIAALLAACWLWVAWAYHDARYSSINWLATYFAIAFALEAVLLVLLGVRRGLSLRPAAPWIAWSGVAMVLFAVLVQPLIGPLVGRPWSQAEAFGIAPDPTVVATLGVIALTSSWPKLLLLPIPILWCLVSGATALAMRSPDSWLMPVAAALAIGTAAGSALRRRGRA